MQTKDFTDPTEALAFIETLEADNSVDTIRLAGGIFRINWIKNKMFTSVDGKEYTDEVWTKEDGTMIVCQDLELEHARNIIRMMLRIEREDRKAESEMMDSISIRYAIENALGYDSDLEAALNIKPILH